MKNKRQPNKRIFVCHIASYIDLSFIFAVFE